MAPTEQRILHIDPVNEWRGGQQQIAYLMQGLRTAGYRQTLVCRKGSPLEHFARENQFDYLALAIHNGIHPFIARSLAAYCRDNGCTLLHAHSSHALNLALLIKFWYRPLKIIAHRRVDFSIRRRISGAFKYNNRWISAIIAVSEAIRRVLIEDGLEPRKIVTIRSGIDVQRIRQAVPVTGLRTELSLPENALLVATVAALTDHKDYPTLIRAIALLPDFERPLGFLFIGEGQQREKIETMIGELKLSHKIRLLGYRRDVPALLKTVDLFVLSSRMEGLGTSLLDAMGAGLNVVATAAGGIPELMPPEPAGYLVPPQNPEALARRLSACISDLIGGRLPKPEASIAGAFDFRNVVQKTIGLYRQISASDIK